MRRFFSAVLVAATIMTVIGAQAGAAPQGDFVVGTGTLDVGLVFEIAIDAHSDASGGNPSGTVAVTMSGVVIASGPVTCLAVTGNTALLTFDGGGFGRVTLQIVDNAGTGSPDRITVDLTPGDVGCVLGGTEFPIVSGDFVVHDAPPLTSKDQCKDEGWRAFADDEGHPFVNQGECVAFLERHAV